MEELVKYWPVSVCITYLLSRLIPRLSKPSSGDKPDSLDVTRPDRSTAMLWYLHALLCLLLVSSSLFISLVGRKI